jgi:opacity protein-like surface antigen
MTNTKAIGLSLILALAVFSAASPAGAQSAAASGKWQFEIMPYFWASGLKTDIKTGLMPEKSTEVSFSELSKLIHFGLASMFEARKDRWGFLIDGSYADLGTTVAQSETMPGDVDVTLKNGNFSLAGLARVVEGQATVDLLAGARYNYMNSGLEATTGPYAGLKKSTTDEWLDGFAGVRLLVSLARAWMLVGYADFGAGGSNFAWQAYAGLDIRFSKVFYGKLGYRYSYFDRDQDRGYLKQAKSGIYAGLGIRF